MDYQYRKQKTYPEIIIHNTEIEDKSYELKSYQQQADDLIEEKDEDLWQEKPAFQFEDGSEYTGNWKREYRHGYGV